MIERKERKKEMTEGKKERKKLKKYMTKNWERMKER